MYRNGLVLGHTIECFDNTLYGFFVFILSPIFFPCDNEFVQNLNSFGAFAAGYITKPIGAYVFGMIGDRKGITLPLTLSIGLAGVPTLIIGFLPGVDYIGYWAPIILVCCRMVQGFLYGGEFSGVNIYIYETVPAHNHGKATSSLISFGVIGAILATISGMIILSSNDYTFKWRFPFIIGGFLAFFCFNLRKTLSPVPVSKDVSSYKRSLGLLYKNYKIQLIFSFVLSGMTTIPLTLATVYSNKIYSDLNFSLYMAMGLNMTAMCINALILRPAGWISDNLGFIKTIKLGCIISAVSSVLAFWLVSIGSSVYHALGFVSLMIVSGTIINGCAFPYMSSLFEKNIRYTGLAISYTMGTGLLSGLSPLIATILEKHFNNKIPISLYVIIICILTIKLLSILQSYKQEQMVVKMV